METINALQQFGLNEKQTKVYLAILELGQAPVQKIAKKAGIERTNTYYVLENLERLGLVSRTIKNNKTVFTALNPQNLEGIFAKQKAQLEHQLDDKKEKLAILLPQLQALYQSAGPKPKITFYEGREGIKIIFWQTLKKGVKEILYLWPAKDMLEILGREDVERYIEKRIALKIKAKVLRVKAKEMIYKKSGQGQLYLRELRFVPSYLDFNLGLMIYEDKVAIIFSKQEDFALLIESAEFAKLQKALFESLWKTSGYLE